MSTLKCDSATTLARLPAGQQGRKVVPLNFKRKKLQFGVFLQENPELQLFPLEVSIGPGFARANGIWMNKGNPVRTNPEMALVLFYEGFLRRLYGWSLAGGAFAAAGGLRRLFSIVTFLRWTLEDIVS
ncbi:MAG: hypothetical protein NVSMB27_30170 [Ktedonobacteraceae bacterium]